MNKLTITLGITVFIPAFLVLSFLMWSSFSVHKHPDRFHLKVYSDISHLSVAIDLYKLDHGIHPENLDDLLGKYLAKSLKDPWGNDYGYISNGKKVIIYTNVDHENYDRQIFKVTDDKI